MLMVSGGYIFLTDAGYKMSMVKRFSCRSSSGRQVIDNLYVYGLFMTGSKDGTTPDLELPTILDSNFMAAVGHFPTIGRHFKSLCRSRVANI